MFNPLNLFLSQPKQQVSLGTRGLFGLSHLTLPLDKLRQHMYIVGSSGAGKSFFLLHLLKSLVTAGVGAGVLDPHSDLASDLIAQLASYPKNKPWLSDPVNRKRVLYLDPSRTDVVVPVNLLKNSVATPYEIAENIVEAFRRVWPDTLAEAPRFAQILRNSILVLAARGLTLLELEPFLTHAEYREKLLNNFPDNQIVSFFGTQYNHWGREQVIMASPVLNKVSAFLFQPSVRLSLGARENRLDLRAIMDHQQVLIVDLGGLTGETQQLYGSLLVTSLEQAAMSRRNQPAGERRTFVCMIDEFPNFITRDSITLARILSEVRKFNVFLGLAHQTIAQTDGRMQGALENAKLKCIFATGRQTAEALAPVLYLPQPDAIKHVVDDPEQQERSHPLFESIYNQVEVAVQQIMRLRRRHVLVKLPEGEQVTELRTPTVPPSRLSREQLDQIKRLLARQIGHSRRDVEAEIAIREQRITAPTAVNDAENENWQEGLWRRPSLRTNYRKPKLEDRSGMLEVPNNGGQSCYLFEWSGRNEKSSAHEEVIMHARKPRNIRNVTRIQRSKGNIYCGND